MEKFCIHVEGLEEDNMTYVEKHKIDANGYTMIFVLALLICETSEGSKTDISVILKQIKKSIKIAKKLLEAKKEE